MTERIGREISTDLPLTETWTAPGPARSCAPDFAPIVRTPVVVSRETVRPSARATSPTPKSPRENAIGKVSPRKTRLAVCWPEADPTIARTRRIEAPSAAATARRFGVARGVPMMRLV